MIPEENMRIVIKKPKTSYTPMTTESAKLRINEEDNETEEDVKEFLYRLNEEAREERRRFVRQRNARINR